jgi:hypothetical protein
LSTRWQTLQQLFFRTSWAGQLSAAFHMASTAASFSFVATPNNSQQSSGRTPIHLLLLHKRSLSGDTILTALILLGQVFTDYLCPVSINMCGCRRGCAQGARQQSLLQQGGLSCEHGGLQV